MQNKKLVDVIEPDVKFNIEESAEVDGQHILAKVKGVFFCPDGKSRNNRYYPKSLWEKALSEDNIQQKLKSRTMFGTLGHETELNDKALQEGRVSHIITNAYIDEDGKGMGEALVLNTKAGRVLNTILRAGSQVFVSSRAEGRFKGSKDGMPVVDEDSYKLETWDFVLNAGFAAANPKLVEELNQTDSNENFEGDNAMNEALKKVMDENYDLRDQIKTLSEDKSKLEESYRPLVEENLHLKNEVSKMEESNKELSEKLEAATSELDEAREIVAVVEELGDSAEEVRTAMENAFNYISEIHDDMGTKEEIREALETAISFKEEVEEIGTVEEIKKALEIGEAMLDSKLEAERQETIAKLAKTCGVKNEAVEKLMDKDMSEEEIVEFFGALVTESRKEDDNIEVLEDNTEEKTPSKSRSRLNRLMEQFN
jgi:hypothetical protein